MNKIWIVVIVFLVFGALTIREQTSDSKSFALRFVDWVSGLFTNLKDLTGHAVSDYRWLPEKNSTTSSPIKTRGG
ncbi:MAG: hypothetical protein AABX47_03165 [Nanoarchaeota archaeon]